MIRKMELRWWLSLWAACFFSSGSSNMLPVFTQDMNNLPLSESTPIGEIVYTLQGMDPEGLPIKYDLVGTDKFKVDPVTGNVTLVRQLDRETEDTLKFLVSIEEQNPDPKQKLVQLQPVTVIVLDENDNPPTFKNSPYEIDVPEDEAIGKTILTNILVEDKDSVGDNLEVGCLDDQWPEACDAFVVVTLNSTANHYTGELILKKQLDYNEKQFYQFQLYATDGTLNSTAHVEVKVIDVQNSPPVFSGSLTGALAEDAPVGSLVLTVKARDADRAQPRNVKLELVTNPLDFFLLDSTTGELRTAKPLDREALADPSSPLNLTVRATEIVNGSPLISDLTSTLATITVTIKDVNDEPPRFNRREYSLEIPESLPVGTPLPNLDMVITDTDVGQNSVFSIRLSDELGAFVVEPATATGSASVTLRLNSSLNFEDPNQRKFILEVIAEEIYTSPRLSSKASVTISLTDVNDNAPIFSDDQYSATVAEAAPAGTRVTVVEATDRDTGRFGTDGIVYQLSGNGAELFRVDNRSGVITVAPCPTPGVPPCLDFETRKDYFLQVKATDDDGSGQMSVVSLQISLTDSNDNPPVFNTPVYKASIDEDAIKFEPELQVQARDVDARSELRYSVIEPATHPFWIDPLSGRILVRSESGVSAPTENDNKIVLTVLATDGVHNATCLVEISVRDVNNHAPVFDIDKYDADVPEDAPNGTEVAAVRATDMDSGINSQIKYGIQKGALDSFIIDNVTGVVSVSSKLDYDKRNTYRIQVLATDMGMPSLTGTAELTIHVINVNDKKPYFTPAIQRAEVSADAELGTIVHNLVAIDPDITDDGQLVYELATDIILKAVDRNGKEVSGEGIFGSWFSIQPNGSVIVSQRLDRSRAAVLTLPVRVTDASATTLQQSDGELIITIVDVNRHSPVFTQPAYTEKFREEQSIGTVLNTYTATDKETPIAAILIQPPSPYFEIDNVTGVVKSTQRIDYEKIHSINFTLVALDSGVPQLSTSASVTVEILNDNDEEPEFAATAYDAAVPEHSAPGTKVVTVTAIDKDEGEFGEVTYSLTGALSHLFTINPNTGVITIAENADIDRENITDIWLRAVASDNAPILTRRSTSVPVHIKVLDINDNTPVFSQKVYKSTIAENLRLDPPAAIVQIMADDKDEGINGKIEYSIVEQSGDGIFTVDPSNGIIYPAKPVVGNTTYHLTVTATDEAGNGVHFDTSRVDITVLSVNKHSPVFVEPPPEQRQLEIPENAAQADFLITTIKATDEDTGENGRVSYYLKVDNQNVGETAEFSLDRVSGELRTKTFLDREHKAEYQLVIAAVDNGTPAQFENLRLLTVVLSDDDDNTPKFQHLLYNFNVKENLPSGIIIGSVKATDKDSGEHGKVYYHLLEGNQDGAFTVDRTQGIIRANISFDRETKSEYSLTIYASNSPLLENGVTILHSLDNNTESQDPSATFVKIKILDENDNAPKFQHKVYYAGIKHTARINEPILSVVAEDPDLEDNGTLVYMVAASNLYKFGASKSSGSVVPSPFNISQDGIIQTAHYMSEYNQDRFVLDIIAQEVAPPHRQAKAQVFIWIIDRSSLIRMVVSRSCSDPVDGVQRRLADASRSLLVMGRRLPLVQADKRYDHWCEVHLHAVDPATYQVLPVEKVLETVDSKYDELKDVYQEYGVETLIAASASSKAPDSFDPALAALIALLIVLFTGIVTFVVVCACLKHWVIPPSSMQSSKGDSLARKRILEELSTTENPLWLETKLRPYEEQELTMNVFGDQNEQNVLEQPPGSTFKPPSPNTPEPPPRPTGMGAL
ncbi:cadherin-87A isoform X2 [Plodia interpunctella]|uniref:cadherin-87A isoform X2 n=1 Tax=Plodia interpunctella TaxID=58824 RepID=UPI002367BD96|nr:cadherin-87A isoform X2 [Plodia interpunctella]